LPAILPRNHKSQNLSLHPTRASQSKLQRIQVISARESGVIFFLKKREEKKKKEKPTLHPKLQIKEFR